MTKNSKITRTPIRDSKGKFTGRYIETYIDTESLPSAILSTNSKLLDGSIETQKDLFDIPGISRWSHEHPFFKHWITIDISTECLKDKEPIAKQAEQVLINWLLEREKARLLVTEENETSAKSFIIDTSAFKHGDLLYIDDSGKLFKCKHPLEHDIDALKTDLEISLAANKELRAINISTAGTLKLALSVVNELKEEIRLLEEHVDLKAEFKALQAAQSVPEKVRKKLLIDSCRDCPYQEFKQGIAHCDLEAEIISDHISTIPEWCPLEDTAGE